MTDRRQAWDTLLCGFVPMEPTAEELVDLEARRREKRKAKALDEHERWLAGSGIPTRLRSAVMTSAQTPAIKAAADYLAVDGGFVSGGALVLAGPTGVGKSYASAAAMIAVGEGRFMYFPALCAQLLRSDTQPAAMACARQRALVVFDDLGTEYLKEGGLLTAFLDEIVWHREGNALPTIITTNLTAEALAARLGDRITDRLRGAWGRVVECPGESLR